MPGTQPEERFDTPPSVARAVRPQQQLLVLARIDDRRVAHRIDACGDARVYLAERDLVGDGDRGLEAGAAGALQIEGRRLRVEPCIEHALAREVEVARVFDDGACSHLTEPHALQSMALDETAQRGGQHRLVALRRVRAMRAREGDAGAADEGDRTDCVADEHLRVSPFASARFAAPHAFEVTIA